MCIQDDLKAAIPSELSWNNADKYGMMLHLEFSLGTCLYIRIFLQSMFEQICFYLFELGKQGVSRSLSLLLFQLKIPERTILQSMNF